MSCGAELRRSAICLAMVLGWASCKSAPTTVLLEVRAGAGLVADELRLTVFESVGRVVKDRRLPPQGPPNLPDTVVLYPTQSSGELRILVQARAGAAPTGEGTARVALSPNEQVLATVTVMPGTLADADGDQVPDAIDSCPGFANPDQEQCPAPDIGPRDAGADLDRGGDRARDAARDQRRDTRKPDNRPPDTKPPPDVTCTPLSGSYTIGQNGGDFSSFSAAQTALKCGVTGPTTFTVAAGTYTQPSSGFSFGPITGASASAPITFRAATGATVKLVGAAPSAMNAGIIRIEAQTQYLTLEGFDLDGSLAQNKLPSSFSGAVYFAQAGGQKEITLRRLRIHDFAFSTSYLGGIFIYTTGGTEKVRIDRCEFRSLTTPGSGQGGIYVQGGTNAGMQITANSFSGLTLPGVYLRATQLSDLVVANNMFVLGINSALFGDTTAPVVAISGTSLFAFNTLLITAATGKVLNGGSSGSLLLVNNLVHGAGTASTFVNGVSVTAPNYNCLYNVTPGYTLGSYDVSGNPQLASVVAPYDLHLTSASPCRGAGAGVSGITVDFDGDARKSPPDIGADEL